MWYPSGKSPNPEQLTDRAINYLISPRPIAWVSTVDQGGRANLAPFSYFMALSSQLVMISCVAGSARHTLRNTLRQRQLVINSVDRSLLEPMLRSAEALEPTDMEFHTCGVTAAESVLVAPPRVSESEWSLECELVETRDYDDGTTLVVARVLGTHVRDELCTDRGITNNNLLRTGGAKGYTTLRRRPPEPSTPTRASTVQGASAVKLLKALAQRPSTPEWIRQDSGLPWLELDLRVPTQEILREWRAVQHRATPWERGDHWQGMETRGWKSLTLHGLSADSHDRQPPGASLNRWTEVADQCPRTRAFIEEHFQVSASSGAIRFLLLEPGGYIVPHNDQKEPGLRYTNIGIDVPEGTQFWMMGHGNIPYRSGSCFIWDHSITHWVVNDSDRPRLHITVVADVKDDVLVRSYEKFKGERSSSPGEEIPG